MTEYFQIKRSAHCRLGDIQKMNPKLWIVFGHFLTFCENHNLPCTITNITGKFKQSKSSTHVDGRALDISVRGWTETHIHDAKQYMERVAGHYGAISARDLKKRVFVYHNVGLGDHIHLQVYK